MVNFSFDGMISGLSTSALVDQLIQAESGSKVRLQTKLSNTEKTAAAYRAINTKFDALRTAAEDLIKPSAWAATKTTSSVGSVTATADASAQPMQLSFSVQATAATHSVISATTWGATSDPSGFGSALEVRNADGSVRGTVTIGGTGTLADTVAAINNSDLGVRAASVQVAPGQYRLQITSSESGAAKAFSVGTAGDFAVASQGADAHLRVGTGPGAYDVYSDTNTFTGLLPGTTITVAKPEAEVTVAVASDPEAVAGNVKALVDAANAALSEITKYAKNGLGSNTLLAGDSGMARLSSQVLTAVYSIVGTDGSPGLAGVEVTRDGTVKFDKEKFLDALKADPGKVQAVLSGTPASSGADGVSGTGDDVAAVPGVAQRLLTLAKDSTNSTTGTLTLLAQGQDKLADDIKDRIEAWDLRLEKRRSTLMRQFTAMEVALGTMKSQSTWLSGQLASLPKYE